jgi:phage terminase large subunit
MRVKLSGWQNSVWFDDHRFKVINVGRRSGKTVLSIWKAIDFSNKPNSIIWVICPSYRQAKLISWALLKEYGTGTPGIPVFNETELTCKFNNGSEICLKGADNPDSLRGTKIDFAIFDEVAFFSNWQTVWSALRPILVDSKAPCWFVSTPNGFNHFYQLYLKEHQDQDYKSFKFTSYDNPYIDHEEIEKAKKELDETTFNQEFMADFTRARGVVYERWPIENYKQFAYDPNLPLHTSWDFGVNDPTSIIWVQPTGSEYRVIDYYEASNADIAHFIQVVRSKPYKEPELCTGDTAGKARTLTTGTSPIEILSQSGIHIRTTDGLKIPEQIRATQKIIPSLFISSTNPNCERFRDIILNYHYPEKSEALVNQSNEIPVHDSWSHGARALEYYAVNSGRYTPKKKVQYQYVGGDPVTGFGRKRVAKGQGFDDFGFKT